jgi:hypothetical protein
LKITSTTFWINQKFIDRKQLVYNPHALISVLSRMWLDFQIKYFSNKLDNKWLFAPKNVKRPVIFLVKVGKYAYFCYQNLKIFLINTYDIWSQLLDFYDEKLEIRLRKNRRFVDVCRYLRWQVTAFGHIMWHNSKWADRFYKLEMYTISFYRSIFFKKKIYISTTIIGLVCIYLFFKLLNPQPTIWFITSLITLMPVFLLWQTFVFFYKTYRVSKFTNANQSFWKRVLFLFWAIEGFLFSIVIFIWFISPSNLKMGTGHNLIDQNQFVLKPNLFESIWLPTLLLITARIFLIYKKNSKTLDILYYSITMIVILSIFIQELCQLISVYTKTRNNVGEYLTTYTSGYAVEIPTLVEYTREDLVINQTTALVCFLKFWHILFVLCYLTFIIIRFIEYKKLSLAVQSSILYNFNYILVFNTCYLVYYYRKLFYFILETPSIFYNILIEKNNSLIYINCIIQLLT